jgi:hydroxysqualene dehydroxylase
MKSARVVVVGGGLAGISAAVACADAGLRVALLEARPRLGGATWSLRRHGLWLDNGQHVFLRCFTAYRELLARLGVTDRVSLQDSLDLPVAAPGGPLCRLRRHSLPRPAHLAPSLLRFSHLPFGARVRAGLTVQRLGRLDRDARGVDEQNLGEWLAAQGESDDAIDLLWDLLIRPTLNLPAREASLALAAKVFQTGLLGAPADADVGWAKVPLDHLHAEPAEGLLRRLGAEVHTGVRLLRIEEERSGRRVLALHGGVASRLEADAVVLAVPHEAAAALLPDDASLDPAALRALGRAAIVNLYVGFDRRVLDVPFLAAVRSPLQWIFDRTETSGLASGQLLAISLSAADEYLDLSATELERRFVPEIARLLPGARDARLTHFIPIREPAATFRQAPGTRRLRPPPGRIAPRVFLAGAWTDTGWPATMEGAVRSGRIAAASVLHSLEGDPRRAEHPGAAAAAVARPIDEAARLEAEREESLHA